MTIEPVATEPDDAALAAAARLDPRAFAPLYERYAVPIHRYCFRRLGSREAAEDATSRTFAAALAALPRWRDGSFRAWLFAIAHHACADDHRRRRPQVALAAAADVVDREPGPEAAALTAEGDRSVQALLGRLPPDQRRVVELRLVGLTGLEIARVLGKRPEAVKSTQFRAYARLRRLLADQVDGEEQRRAG